jgi:type VI secretion system protein ImpK
MSGSGSPFDPFGRNERTIIRPNPAGRRAESRPSAPMAPMPPLPAAPSPPSPQPTGDEWATTPAPMPPSVAAEPMERQRAVILRREELITPNENPVMRTAGPLLLLLGRLRVALLRAPFAQLMEQVADAIQEFEREVRAVGLSPEQARTAKYVLCATADDIVQNIPSEDRQLWTQYSMLSRFFGERIGGVRFFEELEHAKLDPNTNYSLLELQHACLALGFQGIHRTSAGGQATLQQIQRSLYETLRRVKRANPELSPRWQGQPIAVATARSQVPVWAVGSFVGVLLLGIYLLLRALLGGDSEAVAASLVAVHPTNEIAIQRRVFQAPPPPRPAPQTSRIRAALGPPLEIEEKGNLVIIRMSNLALFAPASATVRDEFAPLITKIASVIEKEPGTVKVVGHTDSAPIRSVRFPSNFHLSVERAKAVAALLKQQLSKPERVETEGKGADVPIATNATPEGRAKNRRVEILVQRSN